MTAHKTLLSILLCLLCISNSVNAQLKLSEPKADDEGVAPDSNAPDLPTSSRLRKKQAAGTAPARNIKAANIDADDAADAAAMQGKDLIEAADESVTPSASSPGGAPPDPSLARAGVKKTATMTWSLIQRDAEPSMFFSAAVPRTEAIAEDATLNDVCHVGALCWAVGERGVVCRSDDFGQTWSTAMTPIDCSLQSVCFLTNRIGWIAGYRNVPGTSQLAAVLFQTRDGGESWTDLSATPQIPGSDALTTSTLPGILHVRFFGLNEAMAVTLPVSQRGGAGIFRSDDGGQSWTSLATDQAGSSWNTGGFLSMAEGVVVGQHQSYAAVVSDQAVVINPSQPTLRQMRGVSLNADGSGWIVGDNATIFTTQNSGVTWEPPATELPKSTSELSDLWTVAHSGELVLLGGQPGACVFRSNTNGQQWDTVQLPATGRITKLRFTSEGVVLAVGSFGQILRSEDDGLTWNAARSSNFRSGVLNLVTNADRASWQLLATTAAEQGVRSVTVQMSQQLRASDQGAAVNTSEKSRLAVTQLAGNEAVADWMFPRTRPEHHRSVSQLISEWERQTDGEVRRLLPLRLARELRNWRPAVVVIESMSDDDAVSGIFADALVRAIQIAEHDEHSATEADHDLIAGAESLSALGLAPWSVQRIVRRVPSDRQSSPSYDDNDLLPSLGTTNGLLCDAALRVIAGDARNRSGVRVRSCYEVVMDRNDTVGITNLLQGLDSTSLKGARRTVQHRSGDQLKQLQQVLDKSRIEGSALQGHAKLVRAEESLTAELQNVGVDLPLALAAKQLKDLGDLNLQQNNMEGFIAVQQEIIRRYPQTEDGRLAAEMLFLFYSSEETRYYRTRSKSGSPFGASVASASADSPAVRTPATLQASDLNVNESDAANGSGSINGGQSGVDSGLATAMLITPESRSPQTPGFVPPGQGQDPVAALKQRWDSHAATAFRILSAREASQVTTRQIDPAVLLRYAVNQRQIDATGEQSNALAELSQRPDEFGLFAKSEMQLRAAATSPLPLFNLPRQTERPFLDGRLTDSIWENAQEISLRSGSASGRRGLDSSNADLDASIDEGDDSVRSFSMLAWDEQFLFISARLEKAPSKNKVVELAAARSHDAKHGDKDRFEIELDTDRDYVTSFQLTVDESGQTSDRCWMLTRWNPQWYVAVDSDETAWRIEAAIPFSELISRPAKAGDIWTVRMRRVLPGVLEHSSMSADSVANAGKTGIVRFIRPKVTTESRMRKSKQ
jgi:photosystem II stability/assembly factor-like uncharacterized protein